MCALGPTVYGVTWTVNRVSVFSDSTTKPKFMLYRNVESPTTYVDGSKSGNGDTSETDIELLNLDNLVCVWTGGEPGKSATVILQGVLRRGI